MQRGRRFVKVTRRGQITIPIEVRKRFGMDEGSMLAVEEDEGAVVMRPVRRVEDLAGFLAGVTDEKRLNRILEESRADGERRRHRTSSSSLSITHRRTRPSSRRRGKNWRGCVANDAG